MAADALPVWSRKPVTLAVLVAIGVGTVAVFVPTLSSYVAVQHTSSIGATPVEYETMDSGETLVVTVELENPTRATYTVSYVQLTGYADGTELTKLGAELSETTVSPGETVQIEIRTPVREGQRERTRNALASGTLSATGELTGKIRDRQIRVPVTAGENDA
ncbi:hypothetical protein [Halorussus halophilus]|uniref:hypothetical protein n=1 Tax=Halorussus halophilus TaxID=2650975 RepID=UPI00130109AF|nr:hypothetical protein [Halorussus halophilus]